MLPINYESPDGSKYHNHLWNSGNGWGVVKLFDKVDGNLLPVDEIEAPHIGCEYGKYDADEDSPLAFVPRVQTIKRL